MTQTGTDTDLTAPCLICGVDALGLPGWAIQWAGPTSAKNIGDTCSDACADHLDSFRDADRRITRAGVRRAARAWVTREKAR